MASGNHLTFKIGSAFKGEGFDKAMGAVRKTTGSVRQGAASVQQMSEAFASMDGAASKSLNAVTGVASAIMTLNPAIIATTVGMIALNTYFEQLREKAEAAKKRMDELKASVNAAFSSTLAERGSSVTAEVRNLNADFESITKQAEAFTAALEGVRAASSSGGILKLQTEKLQAMIDAHTEAERQNIEAAYNIRIAQAKRIAAEEAGAEAVNTASEALATNRKRVANIDEQLAKITEERSHLEEALLIEKASGSEKTRQLEGEINKLKQTEIELERKRNAAEENTSVLELKLQKAKIDAANATEAATQGVLSAQMASDKLADAQHARELAEQKAKEKAKIEAAVKDDVIKEVKSAAQIQADANKAAQDLAAAQRAYSEALGKWVDGGGMLFDAIQQAMGKGNANWTKAGVLDAATQKGLAGEVGKNAVDEAIRNGAKTVKDLQRAEREGQRRGRDALSDQSGQMTQEAKKFDRLSKMDPNKLSKADKDFMEKFKQLQEANKSEKQKLADQRKNIDEIAKNAKTMAESLQLISKNMGLK